MVYEAEKLIFSKEPTVAKLIRSSPYFPNYFSILLVAGLLQICRWM